MHRGKQKALNDFDEANVLIKYLKPLRALASLQKLKERELLKLAYDDSGFVICIKRSL